MSRYTRSVSLALTILVLSTAALMANERRHSFRGSGLLNLTNLEFTSKGIATHLGVFTEEGAITSMVEIPGQPGEFLISGWAILTAANGDELHETFSGQLNLVTGAASATITYVPEGTGRFANATGTATLALQLGAGGSFTYQGEGTIDF